MATQRVYTCKDTAAVTPNSDTPYSLVWRDLRAEPVVLSVPAVDKARCYSVMLCDGNTCSYGYIGTRTTGTEAGDYLVVGPDWQGGEIVQADWDACPAAGQRAAGAAVRWIMTYLFCGQVLY